MFQAFYDGNIISDLKAIPVSAKFNQQEENEMGISISVDYICCDPANLLTSSKPSLSKLGFITYNQNIFLSHTVSPHIKMNMELWEIQIMKCSY